MSASLPLDADERRHYEELKANDALKAQALRSVSAAYQNLLKHLREQKPVGEVTRWQGDNRSRRAIFENLEALPIGTDLYINQFALDYLDLVEFWRDTHKINQLLVSVRIPELEMILVSMKTRFRELLKRHRVDVPPDEY